MQPLGMLFVLWRSSVSPHTGKGDRAAPSVLHHFPFGMVQNIPALLRRGAPRLRGMILVKNTNDRLSEDHRS
jgi:hypothetical protein